MDAVNLRT